MKITDVETIILRIPDVQAINDSAQDAIVIRVHTDDGITGLGEVDSSPEVVRAVIGAPRSHRLCTGLAQAIIGQDPRDVTGLWERMYRASVWYGRRGVAIHALSGIDLALWDIAGKAAGQPVHRLLGPEHRLAVPAYASVLMPEAPADVAEAVRRHHDAGFRAVKLGWGPLGIDLDADVERVAAAREAAGDGVEIMIDLGYYPGRELRTGWDAGDVLEFARRIERYRPSWIEEFLPPDDLDGYRAVARGTPIPTAAGENCSTRHEFEDLVERGEVAIVQPDVTRSGGLTECLRVAALANERGVRCIPHAFSTGLIKAASLQLLCAIPNGEYLEYGLSDSPLNTDLFTPPITVRDGMAHVPTEPGLGVSLDEEVVAKYAVS
jgi:L-rhamnonate dehydratase